MKHLHRWLSVALLVAGLSLLGPRTAVAADDDDAAMSARMDRLEQQVHQLAERQGQFNDHPGPMMGLPGRDARMDESRGCPVGRPGHRGARCFFGMLFLLLAVIHILLATWVFTDIRKRGEGSGLFIVLALLAGIPGTILYALIRIGDRRPATP